MKTIRVFVSSPGDVRAERTITDRLIRMTAEELGIPVSVQYSNLLQDVESAPSPNASIEAEKSELILCPYFWEYQRFSPELGYQDQMPNTAQFDLVICILWSRLGTRLHPRFQMPALHSFAHPDRKLSRELSPSKFRFCVRRLSADGSAQRCSTG